VEIGEGRRQGIEFQENSIYKAKILHEIQHNDLNNCMVINPKPVDASVQQKLKNYSDFKVTLRSALPRTACRRDDSRKRAGGV